MRPLLPRLQLALGPTVSRHARHAMLALLVWTASAHLLPAQKAAPSPSGQRPPNVILVMTDDQGYGDLRVHGNTMIRTPNLDALHGQSLRLTDFHVDPTCSPTRSALMTGRYSTRTGVWHTILGRSLMDSSEWTLAEALRAAGYRTGMFGKWHLGENYPLRPMDQGFDEVVCHGGGGVGQGPDWWGNDYFDDTYWRNGIPEAFAGYCTDVWFREALAFIEKHRDRPFFCYLATNAPHGPYLVDPELSEPYRKAGVAADQAKFYGMIENIDTNMGTLLKRLDGLGLADNTILIYMTDNGTSAGRVKPKHKGAWKGFNAGMRGAKGSEYDGGHRVPCFIRWPAGKIGGAQARDEPVLAAHIDILPTLLDLCGAADAQPGGRPPVDGISLAPWLRRAKTPPGGRTLFVHSQRILQPEKGRKSAVMTERWRLVNRRQLFDIVADPRQARDVADEHPEVVQTLLARYDAWWDSLAPAIARTVHIGIGAEAEPVTTLHSHDWQTIGRGGCPWHQNHVRRGLLAHGQWFVDVKRPGTYSFELRRWPRHLEKKLDAERAELRVGAESMQAQVGGDATHATFQVKLMPGQTTVRTILQRPDGKTHGAYFVYVTRVGP